MKKFVNNTFLQSVINVHYSTANIIKQQGTNINGSGDQFMPVDIIIVMIAGSFIFLTPLWNIIVEKIENRGKRDE